MKSKDAVMAWVQGDKYIATTELKLLVEVGLLSKMDGAMLEVAYGIKSAYRNSKTYCKRCSRVAHEWGVDPSDLLKKLKRHGMVKKGKNGERSRPWTILFPKTNEGRSAPAQTRGVAPVKQGNSTLLNKGGTPSIGGENTLAPQGLLSELRIKELIPFTMSEAPSGQTNQNGVNDSSFHTRKHLKILSEAKSSKEVHADKHVERRETVGATPSPNSAATPSPNSEEERRLEIIRTLYRGNKSVDLHGLWLDLCGRFDRKESGEERDYIIDSLVRQEIQDRYSGDDLLEDTIDYFMANVAYKPKSYMPWLTPYRDWLVIRGKMRPLAPKVRTKHFSYIPKGERVIDEPELYP